MTDKENYPPLRYVSEEDFNPVEITSKPTDKEIIKALERLKSAKDYLRECYQNDLKNCKYPEIKPLIKDTHEDNKQAFDIAIKAIEDYNRIEAENNSLRAEIERLKNRNVELFGERNQEHRKLKTAKSEAIKEFAERLKATPMRFLVEYVKYYDKPSIDKMVLFIDDNDIDNLVKEMVGDDS